MTHEQKIDALSNEIRKALPYLMELSEGCLIEDTYNSIIYKVSISTERNILNEKSIQVFGIDIKNKFTIKGFIVCRHHKIIGHEPMLNDVLAWLAPSHFGIQLIDIYGMFCDRYLHYIRYNSLKVRWNLENPYLKDQSEQLINFLYSLIEQKNDKAN